jgi:hypothetical protein
MELTQTRLEEEMPTRKSPTSAEKKPATRKAPTKKAVAAASPAVDSVVEKRNPSYHEIAQLAEQFWNQRGCPFGSPEVDWLRAESTLYA